jgi:hypothetical protein
MAGNIPPGDYGEYGGPPMGYQQQRVRIERTIFIGYFLIIAHPIFLDVAELHGREWARRDDDGTQ